MSDFAERLREFCARFPLDSRRAAMTAFCMADGDEDQAQTMMHDAGGDYEELDDSARARARMVRAAKGKL